MSNTTSIVALRPEIWRKEVYADRMDALFFNNRELMGTGDNVVIQVQEDLKKSKGDQTTFGLVAKISSRPVTGDSELEGNEAALSSYDEACAIDQFRFGVRLSGALDEQKSIIDFRMQAKEKLAIAQAEFIERQIFMKLGGVSTLTLTDTNAVVYSADATWSNSATIVPAADEADGKGARYICADADGLDSITATDILTPTLISRAKVLAQMASPRIAPLRINGKDYWVMFVHPHQAYDMKTQASGLWAQAQREAADRGKENGIFTGALGVWDGVILHEHEYVPTAQASSAFGVGGTAAATRAFRALLCGRQACVMAETSKSNLMIEETFDYKNKVGYALNFIGGIQKPTFNGLDYGVICVDTGATALNGN